MKPADLRKLRVPRYTSYPPITRWSCDPERTVIDAALASTTPCTGVYVHLPFCRSQCSYCGCNMAVARNQAVGDTYLAVLDQQVTQLAMPRARMPASHIHLGGGTPTWFTPQQLATLVESLKRRFRWDLDSELSVEAAPHTTRIEHLVMLEELGFTRVSFGVQSFSPIVMNAVQRPLQTSRVGELIGLARQLGIRGVNLDLMYGLPHQTPARFRETLETAAALRPDRMAVFAYAHLPHAKRHQSSIDATQLPSADERRVLATLAREVLISQGYEPVGMDHFALPDDPLARAARAGRLRRSFMGYTSGQTPDLVGLGVSAISEVSGVCWQDEPKLGRWLTRVRENQPLAVRGWVLEPDDLLRREVIVGLLCNNQVDLMEVCGRHGVDATSYFCHELERLGPFLASELATFDDLVLRVSPEMPEALRPVASLFDATSPDGTGYSLAI